MSETPRTNEIDAMWDKSDSAVDAFNDARSLCRELERELAAANDDVKSCRDQLLVCSEILERKDAKVMALVEALDLSVDQTWNGPMPDFVREKCVKAKALP